MYYNPRITGEFRSQVYPFSDLELSEAANKGNLQAVREIFQHSPGLKRLYHDPKENLLTACQAGNLKDVTLILAQDPSLVSSFSENESTPLLVAVDENHLQIVQLLFCAGADPNQRGNYGDFEEPQPPLVFAQTEEMVQALIKKGADINYRAVTGETLLHLHVLCESDVEILERLLQFNPELISVLDQEGFFPLDTACGGENLCAAKFLYNRGAPCSFSFSDGNPLQIILEAYRDKDPTRKTYLTYFLMMDPPIEDLLSGSDSTFREILKYAFSQSSHSTFKLLIEAGLSPLITYPEINSCVTLLHSLSSRYFDSCEFKYQPVVEMVKYVQSYLSSSQSFGVEMHKLLNDLRYYPSRLNSWLNAPDHRGMTSLGYSMILLDYLQMSDDDYASECTETVRNIVLFLLFSGANPNIEIQVPVGQDGEIVSDPNAVPHQYLTMNHFELAEMIDYPDSLNVKRDNMALEGDG